MSILRNYEELSEFEKLGLISMSYSRLETFKSCEAKYFYQYIDKQPRSTNGAAAMGTAVHSVLEKSDLNDLDLKDMLYQLELEFEAEDPDGDMITRELKEAARELLGEFVDRHYGDTFETLGKELNFNVVIGNGYFTGFIDRVDITPSGGILIQDYKAGKWKVAKKDVPTNMQLGLYACAIRKFYPEYWPITAELYYLREGKMFGQTYTHEELDNMEFQIRDKCAEIAKTNFFHYTGQNWTCKSMCDFGKSGVCPRGKTVLGTW